MPLLCWIQRQNVFCPTLSLIHKISKQSTSDLFGIPSFLVVNLWVCSVNALQEIGKNWLANCWTIYCPHIAKYLVCWHQSKQNQKNISWNPSCFGMSSTLESTNHEVSVQELDRSVCRYFDLAILSETESSERRWKVGDSRWPHDLSQVQSSSPP
jgi:hypothetical protein